MSTYYVKQKFRKLDDEQIGQIQHRLIDLHEKVKDLAKEFGVSGVTLYRVKNAVPEDLIHFDDLSLYKFRRPARKRAKPKAARLAV